MTPEPGETGELPPDVQITMVAEAVLVRAGLNELHAEVRANFDFLETLRQPTLEDLENSDDLQAMSIGIYTTSRLQTVSDMELLDDARHLADQAIGLLEGEMNERTMLVSFSLTGLRDRLDDLTHYQDLAEPLEELRDALYGNQGREHRADE